MNFVYKDFCFPIFFKNVSLMIEENYSFMYNEDYTVSLGLHNFDNVVKIKEAHPRIKKLITYQLEPLVPEHWWPTEKIIENISLADEVWDYDLQNIKILKQYGINAKFRPFVYSKSLKTINNLENPDIDLLFYGTLTQRRAEIINKINMLSFFKNVILYNFEGNDLNEFIARSKIILNFHASDYHRQEQSRISHLLNNNKCVISEKSNINYFNDLIHEVSGNNLEEIARSVVYKTHELLQNNKWKESSTNLSDKLKILDAYKKQHIILEAFR